jgi:hypothetical protein
MSFDRLRVKTRTLQVRFLRFWELIFGPRNGLEKINNRKNRKNRENRRHHRAQNAIAWTACAAGCPAPGLRVLRRDVL